MSIIGFEVLPKTNLKQIEKAFGRPNVKEYRVQYMTINNKRFAQFHVRHSNFMPVQKDENIELQRWLQDVTKLGLITRLDKLQEVEHL